MSVDAAPSFGELLLRGRTRAGVSRAELAGQAGLSEIALEDLERDASSNPTLDVAQRLADALDLDHDQRATLLAARGAAVSASLERQEAGSPRQSRLPAHANQLIGREHEIETVLELLNQPGLRLLTLTGPGGIGKTRLALTIGARADAERRQADGVHFVDLSAITDSDLVVNAIAQAVGVRAASGRGLDEVLADFFRPKRLLLILDNFEQVIPAALKIARILTTSPGVTILVTSREALLISHEHLYAVPPLPVTSHTRQLASPGLAVSDSVHLFAMRAQQVRADFQLTPDNADDIKSICQRLDGLPLAIELAAARIAMFTPRALLKRMDRALPLLTGGPRDAPPRLRSMHDAIVWSYDLLSPEEQRIFRALACFAGGWTIEAAEDVCAPDAAESAAEPRWSIVELLSSLVAKNLVQAAGDVGPDPRFTMLQTIREYGLEQLESESEFEAIGQRHARYYRQLAAQAEPALCGANQVEWLDRLELEFPNLRLAVVWSMEQAMPDDGVLIVSALSRLWHIRLHVAEGRELLARLLSHRASLTDGALSIALIEAGDLAQFQGDYDATAGLAEEGLSIARSTGDMRATARGWGVIGANYQVQGMVGEAISHLTEALAIAEAIDDKTLIAQILWMLGDTHRERGEIGAGRAMLESSLAIARSVDDMWQVAWTLGYLADAARSAGELEQALDLDQESLALQRDLKSNWGIVGGISGLAVLAATWDQAERAARLLGARAAMRAKLGMPYVWPMHRHWYDPMVQKLREDLGEDAFDALWAEGAALTIDQVVAEGLEVTLPAVPAPATQAERPTGRKSGLSPRELEVLRMFVEGHSDREIARELRISPRTATTHVSHILNKFGVDTRTAAATHAVRNGLA